MKVAVTGATGVIGRELVERAARPRRRGHRALARRGSCAAGAGRRIEAFDWADPKQQPAPAEALARPGRRGPPARRERRPALERRGQEGDPRLARARHAQPGRGPARRPSRARGCWSRSRPAATTARGATSAWTSPGRRGDDFLAGVTAGWEEQARRAEELGLRVVDHPHGRRAGRGRRRARQDAALLQGRGRRTGCRRAASTCRGSTSTTWSARCSSASTTSAPRAR